MVERSDGVATATLNRPDAPDAMSIQPADVSRFSRRYDPGSESNGGDAWGLKARVTAQWVRKSRPDQTEQRRHAMCARGWAQSDR